MTFVETIKSLTTRQKIILSIYFVVGLPALPIVPVLGLLQRYVMEDKKLFSPENRQYLIITVCSWMITYSVFFSIIYFTIRCLNPR